MSQESFGIWGKLTGLLRHLSAAFGSACGGAALRNGAVLRARSRGAPLSCSRVCLSLLEGQRCAAAHWREESERPLTLRTRAPERCRRTVSLAQQKLDLASIFSLASSIARPHPQIVYLWYYRHHMDARLAAPAPYLSPTTRRLFAFPMPAAPSAGRQICVFAVPAQMSVSSDDLRRRFSLTIRLPYIVCRAAPERSGSVPLC